MAVTIKDIEKSRPYPQKRPKTLDQEKPDKEEKRVLRPWETYQREEDLLEIITKRSSEKSRKNKVQKKEFIKNGSLKEKENGILNDKESAENFIDQMDGISDDLKKRLKELSAELQNLN